MSEIRIDDLPVREELRGKSPYGAPQLDVPVRLNTNENPYPLPDALVERIAERVREAARHLNRYPDRDAVELRTRLAQYLNDTALTGAGGRSLGTENVWAANGSNEVLQQLLQTFGGPGRTAIGFEPSYSMHALIARGTGTGWISGPRNDDFTIDVAAAEKAIAEHRPDVVFVTTPNNPTGNAVPAEAVLALYDAAQAARPSIVVVDEAYVEFSHGSSLLPLLEGRPHLVISRTMSKAFGAAGLRLGYFAAHPAVVDAVQLVRLPYHLSAVTQATALAALEHTGTLLGYVEQLKEERDRLVAELRGLGYEVTDSDANFVQFGRFEDAHATWRSILDHGVLVRDNGVPGWLRVTAGTPAENDAFLEAVRTLAKDHVKQQNKEHN
ncbi:histidinol-phosphate transaminase [Streptomyces fragilis]|uniref:Histidinol-phosphate aminotransferase n=1 Tax=Streptomyces fragilis TaxID=67301 RepID=A0ABV2YBH8_9ACTN|nr:histidinol-phosphate transaminase [Streptomyces fragilis]